MKKVAETKEMIDPNTIKRITVDFPEWMIAVFDEEAAKLQIPRQAVIKTWLAQMIQEKKKSA